MYWNSILFSHEWGNKKLEKLEEIEVPLQLNCSFELLQQLFTYLDLLYFSFENVPVLAGYWFYRFPHKLIFVYNYLCIQVCLFIEINP